MSRRFAFYNTEMDGKICSMLHDGDAVMDENDAEIVLNNLWDAYKDEVERTVELEKEKEILRVVCEKADGIACNCTITDSQAVERLLALFEKNRDFYIPFKPREPTQAAYDELFNDKDK